MKKIIRVSACLAGVIFLSAGCSTYHSRDASMRQAWSSGHPEIAARQYGEKADKDNNTGDAVIWHLEAGTAYRAATDYKESNRHFDVAIAKIDDYEQQAKVKLGHETAAMLSNQENLPYEGKSYDKIMVQTYKALNYLALGDVDRARPEIIRAYQRQQDAVQENARRIENAKKDESKSKEKAQVEKAQSDPKFQQSIQGTSAGTEGFKVYADYVNPFTVYLDGLYFMFAGAGASDLEHANKSFRRVIEVAGGNKFIQSDLALSTGMIGGQAVPACTYVIFETGQAPTLDQIRIDVPILFANVSYVGASFPRLIIHDGEVRSLAVKAGDAQENTEVIGSMDSIATLDFKNELPVIITKTLIATVAKAAAAYGVNQAADQANPLAGALTRLATAATQAAMNIADTRAWTTLPKNFQVARVSTPADRMVELSAPGAAPVSVKVQDGTVNVIYVRSVNAGTPLLVSQFKLK